jgi:hypothetical protein
VSEDQRKHLELIQAVINRIAGNSFLIKGWSVTLVSALFALAAKDADQRFVVISYFPCIMFWVIDSYYLSQERRFRALYDSARHASNADFSMDTSAVRKPANSWASAFLSRTMLLFHGLILTVISLVMWKLGK